MQVRIDGWQKGIRFSSAHLTADLGKCERIHGHTYAIHAILDGDQGENRIIVDFVDVVRTLKSIADDLDHYLLVPANGGRYVVSVEGDTLTMRLDEKTYRLPVGDCHQLSTPSATAEDLVKHVMGLFMERLELPPGVDRVRLGVDEGYGQGAWTDWKRNTEG